MKKLKLLIPIIGILFLVNCKGDSPKPVVIPTQDVAEKLAIGDWGVTTVTNNKDNREEWANFKLTVSFNSGFTGGTYATTGLPTQAEATKVWKASGTWVFADKDPTKIYKDGDTANPISVTIYVDKTTKTGTLSLAFTVPEATTGGRTDGFQGAWVFNFKI